MSQKKSVRFSDVKHVLEYDNESYSELKKDVTVAKDIILAFLRSPVYEIIYTPARHFSSLVATKGKPPASHYPPQEIKDDVDPQLMMNQFINAVNRYAMPYTFTDASLKKVNKYLRDNMKVSVAQVMKEYIDMVVPLDKPSTAQDVRIHEYACLALLHLGLYSFAGFHQCQNKCRLLMHYKDGNITPAKTTHSTRKYRDLYGTCILAHDEIKNALGFQSSDHYAFTIFDALLKKASSGKCSFVSVD